MMANLLQELLWISTKPAWKCLTPECDKLAAPSWGFLISRAWLERGDSWKTSACHGPNQASTNWGAPGAGSSLSQQQAVLMCQPQRCPGYTYHVCSLPLGEHSWNKSYPLLFLMEPQYICSLWYIVTVPLNHCLSLSERSGISKETEATKVKHDRWCLATWAHTILLSKPTAFPPNHPLSLVF
jgi:hypothetical protein